jgi:hypothetical protein
LGEERCGVRNGGCSVSSSTQDLFYRLLTSLFFCFIQFVGLEDLFLARPVKMLTPVGTRFFRSMSLSKKIFYSVWSLDVSTWTNYSRFRKWGGVCSVFLYK